MKKLIFLFTMSLTMLTLLVGCNKNENDVQHPQQSASTTENNGNTNTDESQSEPQSESSTTNTEQKLKNIDQENTILDLAGEWKQIDCNSETFFQTGTVKNNIIEIFWVNTENNSKALYWSGTYSKPDNYSNDFSWDSLNNTEKTKGALMASNDTSKTFTYKDGIISYDVTAMGITQTVKLQKIN